MLIDLTNKIFGRLTVVSFEGMTAARKSKWKCVCQCGNAIVALSGNLKKGQTKSCGCLHREVTARLTASHGMTRAPEYRIWSSMKYRCQTDKNYYGRGIKVCDRWLNSFENFFADMGHRPSSNLTIERDDNDRGYEPGNCRWATRIEQISNRRNTIWITYRGERLDVAEASRRSGISSNMIRDRLRKGWTFEAALETPNRYSRPRIVDGSDGPMPNRAMALVSMIDESLHGPGNF